MHFLLEFMHGHVRVAQGNIGFVKNGKVYHGMLILLMVFTSFPIPFCRRDFEIINKQQVFTRVRRLDLAVCEKALFPQEC